MGRGGATRGDGLSGPVAEPRGARDPEKHEQELSIDA